MKQVVSVIFCLIGLGLSAQVSSFTSDPEKFPDQLEKHLGSFDKRDAKAFVAEFAPIWATMNAADRNAVASVCNTMISQKIRIYPDFKGYISAVYHIYKKNLGSVVFHNWNDVVIEILKGKRKSEKEDLLENSGTFFERGSFYANHKLDWRATGGSFEWKAESGDAVLYFKDVRLACYVNEDSTVLYNTGGRFFYPTAKFVGRGGKLEWTRTGLDPKTTYAEFETEYDVNMKTASYRLDSVKFYTSYFEKPLIGSVSEKVLKVVSNREPNYPVFDSYNKRLVIENLLPGIDYDGGFTMKGATFQGSGTPEQPARIIFKDEDENPFVITEAIDYQINDKRILSEQAAVKILIKNDTIYHPGLYFLCNTSKEVYQLNLSRIGVGITQSPFINTYHNLEMYVQAIKWNQGDSLIRMGPDQNASDKTEGFFQSTSYFDEEVYYSVGNGYSVNPLTIIGKHAMRFDQFKFSLADIATAMGQTTEQFKPTLFNLNSYGFVTYDKFNEQVYINQKLFDYMEYVSGLKDHDDVVLASNAYGQDNAVLNLNSYDLTVKGLKQVVFAQRKYVKAFPNTTGKGRDKFSGQEIPWGQVTVKENRNIIFDGILLAGSTEYFGSKFEFIYDDFKIEMPECDSMRLRVWPFEGGEKQVRLISVIEDLKGVIEIDDTSNRAGRNTSFNQYPILHSTKEAFVYYDKFYQGAYPRETFRFIVHPFELDSLVYVDRDHFHVDGLFQSAGIFPDFKEKLVIMRDYSLGFIKKAPPGGLGLYTDRGNFKNEITLTAKGLQGDGTINYLTSSSVSSEWIFFPDSTVGIVETFDNKSQLKPSEVPMVTGKGVKVNYNVKANALFAQSVDRSLLNFFGDEAQLKGELNLTPSGMTGRGRMIFDEAQIAARKFSYREQQILSDTAAFYLRSIEEGQAGGDIPFKTKNVNAKVDFKERMGLFKSNGDSSYVEFPDNQYICYMDEMKWYMDDGDIEMHKDRPLIVESTTYDRPNFISVHPDQDSLSFMAPKARFDMKKKLITCTEVAFIDVADVRIVPDSGKVLVRKKARIETLENAEIIANIITQNHRIVDATVDIFAKRRYKGKGNYFYVDEDKNETKINFAKIEPDTSFTTYAEGEIPAELNFKLSKHFEFYGKIELYAINPYLIFDGAARISHNCDKIGKSWMNFRAQIDPMDIYIPIEERKISVTGNSLGAGMIMNTHRDSLGLYPVFLSNKGSSVYPELVAASGFLYYDKAATEYRIASKDKLQERSIPGNYVSLHTQNCVVEGDGKINFGSYTGQVKVGAIGVYSYNIDNRTLSLRSTVSFDFPFIEKAMGKMHDKMKENTQLLGIEIGKTFYTKALKETFDREKAEKIEADITLGNGIGKFPSELLKTLYLADVRFKWDAANTAYVSEGLIGIANIYKDELFKYVTGKVVIEKQHRNTGGSSASRDRIKIYLEADGGNWYYFEYSNNDLGNMEVSSSDKEFLAVISETNEDKLQYKGEKGVEDYRILVNPSQRNKILFLDTYE